MSLLSMARYVAINASLEPPVSVEGQEDDEVKLVQFINESGAECARRVDWSALRKRVSIVGDDVTALHKLPADFARFVRGLSVTFDGEPVRGGLTSDEWFALPPTVGAPRYFYHSDCDIGFFPILPLSESASVQFISCNWVKGDKGRMTKNEEQSLVNEDLISRGALWRMRRHIGADYQDYLAEFEAMLSDMATADGGVRLP